MEISSGHSAEIYSKMKLHTGAETESLRLHYVAHVIRNHSKQIFCCMSASVCRWPGVERREVLPAGCPVAHACEVPPRGAVWLQ